MLRNYQKMAEYCLYYTFQDETGLSKIMGKCVNPVAEYLLSEFKKANVTISEIAKLFPSKTGGNDWVCFKLDYWKIFYYERAV